MEAVSREAAGAPPPTLPSEYLPVTRQAGETMDGQRQGVAKCKTKEGGLLPLWHFPVSVLPVS